MSDEPVKTDGARPELPPALIDVVRAAQNKQASDVVVLDLRGAGAFTDFFVICSGRHTRQVKAIADAVEAAIAARGTRPRVEGYGRALWVLLDGFDVVVHVFTPETRAFYDLERLWGSATRVEIAEVEDARSEAG